MDRTETAKEIIRLASTLKYSDWCKVTKIVGDKFSQEASKTKIEYTEGLERLIDIEFTQ